MPSYELKEPARRALSALVARTGVTALGRVVAPKRGAVILMGHRVGPDVLGYLPGLRPEWFEAQVEYLCRRYEIISLSRLVDLLERGEQVPDNSVVLTFDDGFRDNLEIVAPVLARHGVPGTVFLTTGCASTGELPWSQRLGYLFEATRVSELKHESLGAEPVELSDNRGRRRAYRQCKEDLKRRGRLERERLLDGLSARLEVVPPRDRMLTWDGVRELVSSGMEVGAHTVSHPLLANIPADEARCEMERSLDDLRRELGVSRPSFAFPGGSRNPGLVSLARQLGFRSVFQSRRAVRVNQLGVTDPFSLSRIGLPNGPVHVLEAELDGPFHWVRGLYRRD